MDQSLIFAGDIQLVWNYLLKIVSFSPAPFLHLCQKSLVFIHVVLFPDLPFCLNDLFIRHQCHIVFITATLKYS